MYCEVYKEMVTGGIARRLDNKVCMTKEGETDEENDANRLGLATRDKVVRPDRLLVVDKVGSNTLQTKDGNVCGEKFCKKFCAKHYSVRTHEQQQRTHTSPFLDLLLQRAYHICVLLYSQQRRSSMQVGNSALIRQQNGLATITIWKRMRDEEGNDIQWCQHMCTMV